MHPYLTIATRAARKGGDVVFRHHNQIDRLTIEKKDDKNITTNLGKKISEVIAYEINKSFPEHTINCRVGGKFIGSDPRYLWLIDPLDSNSNFISGLPHYATSIAFFENQSLAHTLIYDPFKSELFLASRGQGAFLEQKRLRIKPAKHKIDPILIATALSSIKPQQLTFYLKTLKAVYPDVVDIRCSGSVALDLAYIAAGRLDGCWHMALNAWQMTAGALLIREAGGFISDFGGGNRFFDSGNLIAGNPNSHALLLKNINPLLNTRIRY